MCRLGREKRRVPARVLRIVFEPVRKTVREEKGKARECRLPPLLYSAEPLSELIRYQYTHTLFLITVDCFAWARPFLAKTTMADSPATVTARLRMCIRKGLYDSKQNADPWVYKRRQRTVISKTRNKGSLIFIAKAEGVVACIHLHAGYQLGVWIFDILLFDCCVCVRRRRGRKKGAKVKCVSSSSLHPSPHTHSLFHCTIHSLPSTPIDLRTINERTHEHGPGTT